jgi:hypothetical protein
MVIESTSIKTVIDLLESLRKNSLIASNIRLSYTVYGGTKRYATFNSLDEIKNIYTTSFSNIVRSRKSPFTLNAALAENNNYITTVGNLILSNNISEAQYNYLSGVFCSTGSLVTLESFNVQSYLQEYGFSFIVKDVTTDVKISSDSKFDLRRQDEIKVVLERFKSSLTDYLKIYNKIYTKLKYLFVECGNVNICYAEIGYFEFTFDLYKFFFLINKKSLSSGISEDVFDKVYLRLQDNIK